MAALMAFCLPDPCLSVSICGWFDLERAVRLELTYTGFAVRRLAAWRRAQIGTEGEIRTLDSSLEDSHVSSYITSACGASQGNSRLGCGVRSLISNGTPGRT